MFRNDFNLFARKREAGFTLMEACVGAGLSLIVGLVVHRFYRDAYHTYSQQEQVEERNQNANFTVSKMVEIFQQAGTGLPDTGWTSLTYSSGVLTLGNNPSGFQQFIGTNPASSRFVAVDDVSRFNISTNPMMTTTHILVDYTSATATAKFQIDSNYSSSGFSKGLKNNASGRDSLYLTTNVDLNVGDVVNGYREDEYRLIGDSLVVRPNGSAAAQMVLAESIDSLGFSFLNKAGTAAATWNTMRSVNFAVRARTSKKDYRMSPAAYHKITIPMNVILRNRV